MPKPESRSRLRRALRTSWRVLKLTLAPSDPANGALVLDEEPPAPRVDSPPAAPSPVDVTPPIASAPTVVEAGRVGLPASDVAAPAPSSQSLPTPAATASAEILTLVQARLDLFSERLELLREQVVAATALASANAAAPRPEPAPRPRPGSLRREVGGLSERLERLERLERKHGAAEELPSRAALRPPRVPSGLDLFESPTSAATADWDFLDGAVMGPRLMGTFQDLRLATLLEVLQLERRVGVLIMRTPEHTLELDLRRGSVTSVRRDGVEADLVAVIREAFRWPSAEFTFRRSETVRESGAPRSIHGLLLEVARQNDEAARAG